MTPARPPAVLHVLAPAPAGGLERVVQALAIGQHRRGQRGGVAVILEQGASDHPFLRPLLAEGVPTHLVSVPPRGYLRERRAIRDVCLEVRPDVVHTHGYRPDILDAGVARQLGIATVTTVHGNSFMGGRTQLYEWLQWRAYRRFHAVVAVSRPLAAELAAHGIPPELIQFIPNAWPEDVTFLSRADARLALGVGQNPRVIGWTGRLIPVKGADVFLEALARTSPASSNAVLIGDGTERTRLTSLVESLGLSGRVVMPGAIESAARLFPGLDLFVLSSRSEGTPIVLLEAMAAGVPVIASGVGGIPDLLADDAGWLVPAGNPGALAVAIQTALADPAEASRRANRARQRLLESFGLESFLTAYGRVYQAANEGRAGSGGR